MSNLKNEYGHFLWLYAHDDPIIPHSQYIQVNPF